MVVTVNVFDIVFDTPEGMFQIKKIITITFKEGQSRFNINQC
jgi:hypothetical protein